MPTMHVSVFLRPKDAVNVYAHHGRDFHLIIKMRDPDGESSEVVIFAEEASQLLALGRSIVEQCEQLIAGPATPACDIVDYAIASAERTPYAHHGRLLALCKDIVSNSKSDHAGTLAQLRGYDEIAQEIENLLTPSESGHHEHEAAMASAPAKEDMPF